MSVSSLWYYSTVEAGSLKMNTALEYSTRVVQEGAVDVKRVLLTI